MTGESKLERIVSYCEGDGGRRGDGGLKRVRRRGAPV
jgi:hypothetical protein